MTPEQQAKRKQMIDDALRQVDKHKAEDEAKQATQQAEEAESMAKVDDGLSLHENTAGERQKNPHNPYQKGWSRHKHRSTGEWK